MELIAAFIYVLGVYVIVPMYFWGAWERQQEHADPVARLRRRGLDKIRRELARRREGLVDTVDERQA